jgi:DNA-binding transcriptional LysR family regulator
MDTFASIKAFVRVVEAGGFAGAARSLGLSTAMVSKHIAALESHLGARLLDRNTRKSVPTEAGRRFYERCMEVLAGLEEAQSELMDDSRSLRGVLRVTAPVEFGNAHLAPLVPRFLELHPQLKVSLDFTNRVVDLVAEGMDLAIRVARELDTSLAGRQLAVSRLMVLAAPAYLSRASRPDRPMQLAAHPALCFAVPSAMNDWRFQGADGSGSVRINARLETTSSEALRVAAIEGSGITLLPTFVAGRDLAAGRLVALFPDHDFGTLRIHAVYPHRKHMPAKVRAFLDFLLAHFGGDPARDPFVS